MGSKFLINYLRQKWCDLQSLFVAPRLGCACAQPSCGLQIQMVIQCGNYEAGAVYTAAVNVIMTLATLELLKDGTIHMCLPSVSGYRPLITQPPALGK